MKKALLTIVVLAMWFPVVCIGGEFSFFGVQFGMTREEVDKAWKRLDTGEYYIKDSVVLNVKADFDYRDRLFELTFSVPLPDKYPAALVSTAYQSLVSKMWQQPELNVNVRIGRGAAETTVTNKKLQKEYAEHIQTVLAPLLRP